jgi:hypothetical protein
MVIALVIMKVNNKINVSGHKIHLNRTQYYIMLKMLAYYRLSKWNYYAIRYCKRNV